MLKPNSTVTNNLIKARELIADEKNWCQGMRRSGDRKCAIQALRVAEGFSERVDCRRLAGYPALKEAAHEIGSAIQEDEPALINDRLGHAATMRMFDRAIELSLQEPTPTPAD